MFADIEEYNDEDDEDDGYRRLAKRKNQRSLRSSYNEGFFTCPNKCGRVYHLKNSLYKHLKFDCGVEKQFECQVCHKAFSRKTSMRNHLFLVHKIVGK